ncbi:hypothetical protein EW145_g1847 [Phellinidium pouzarii]|uniref:Enoyl reductase (ER) domain-containing protein n=1 Tax=Phellinidium pouzarii TaxID=167371 RepID=A0A4S4LII1_9AGAM|nr:hypothetical protein EW145_g1847 [Phellinidium pouzarii]
MAGSRPTEQLGVLSTKTSVTLKSFPVPSPGPNEVLVRNVAVASNPKDWKVPQWLDDYEFIEGNDIAGIVADVGEGVTEYKIGDRVAAFTKMRSRDNKCGAYAQYSVAPASTTFPIPQSVSYEAASTLPLAAMTAAIGLFLRLEVPEPPVSGPSPSLQEGIIINGASSSVGAYAVQLAKRAGLFVIGVAGSSKDYAAELGADVVVDYREHKGDDLERALVAAAGKHPISYAYDAVTLDGSTVLLSRVLSQTSPTGKGRVTFVLGVSDEEKSKLPAGITPVQTLVGTAYSNDEAFAARFYHQISQWLVSSSSNPTVFETNRVRVVPGGLSGVAKGLDQLKNNEVHAEKLVYRIAETPGIQA